MIEGLPPSRFSFSLTPAARPAAPKSKAPVVPAETPGDHEVYASLLGQAKLRQAMQVYAQLDEAEVLQDVQ